MRRTPCVTLVVLFLLFLVGNGFAGGYLKIDGVNGESTDKDHKEWIDILAWSWGVEKELGHVGGGTECSRPDRKDLVISKLVDSTSPSFVHLAESCDTQDEAVLEVEIGPDPSGRPPVQRVMRIHMRNVMVMKVEMGSSAGEERPTENLTLNY